MRRFGVFLCSVLLCVSLTAVMWSAYRAAEEEVTPLPTVATSTTAPPVSQVDPPVLEEPPTVDQGPTLVLEPHPFPAFSAQSGNLVLVDSGYVGIDTQWQSLPDTMCTFPYRLQTQAYQALIAMLADYPGVPLQIVYAAAMEGTSTLCPPVCSNGTYASGLDLCFVGIGTEGTSIPFAAIKDGREWLYRHCASYGFIACGEDSFSEQAGHFRYVGVVHANRMQELDLSLQAYLARLRLCHLDYQSAWVWESDSVRYRLFYTVQDAVGNSSALLPKGAEYILSGDNRGGVIVLLSESIKKDRT